MELDTGDGRGGLSRPAHRQACLLLDLPRLPLRAFTNYISNPDYGWDRICQKYFGTHPAQVFFDWNTAPHGQEYDGRPTKRPYTREEISALFDYADDEVERIAKSGARAGSPRTGTR